MNKLLIVILIILALITLIYFGFRDSYYQESFENPLDPKTDKIDKLYGKMYDKLFNEKETTAKECKMILDFINKHPVKGKGETFILDCGTGTGKHYQYLQSGGIKVIGLERSDTMLDIFKTRNPLGKVFKGDMRNENLFEGEKFSYILCLKETLYHNQIKDWDSILSNFYFWLKPGGYLVVNIFDKENLDPTPMNISMLRKDFKGRKHSITNFPNFTHDGWWERRGNTVCQYNEIFAIRNSKGTVTKKRHYKHNLAIPEKDKIMEKVLGNYFKLIKIVKLEDLGLRDHDLFFFKKNKF